jgi:type IV secretion system protein VirB3
MHGPRETVFHSSINRPNLLMGGDRELVLGAAMISALFIFALMTWWSILIGVVFWPLTTSMLVQLAKADPRMRDVATRSFQYKAYYPAKSGVQASGGHGSKGDGGLNDFWTGVCGDSVRGCVGMCPDSMGGARRKG